jgi:L-lactate dehydrogenase complex protein LldG
MFTEDNHSSGFFSSLKNIFVADKQDVSTMPEAVVSEEIMIEEFVPEKVSTEEILDRPMRTRTVDYSHLSESATDIENMVASNPIQQENSSTTVTNEVVVTAPAADLDILFATNFIEKGGKFIYCETIKDVVEELKHLSHENNWKHVFCWENEIKDAFCNNEFQKGAIGYTIENSDAAMCLCETLIAENGNIILSPKQASRRRLPVFPKTQLFLIDTTHLASDINKALDKFNIANKGDIPSILDLHDNIKGHYYHDGNLVLKAEGPSDIYVFLIDEFIPKSTRP